MKEKKQCVICRKKRKENYLKVFSYIKVCSYCIRSDKELKEYIKTYEYMLKQERKYQFIQNGDATEYSKTINETDQSFQNLEKFIESRYQFSIEKNKIINDVINTIEDKNVKNIKLNKNNIKKTLNSFEIDDLNKVEKKIKKVNSYTDLAEDLEIEKKTSDIFVPNPKDLFNNINQYVMGQDQAIRDISIAIVKHWCRFYDPSIAKSNILIAGPTGTGKTEIVRTLSEILQIPIAIVDASSFTASGYKGTTASDAIVSALLNATDDITKAQKSIVFIDEIDKKANFNSSGDGDIRTSSVQQELLKIIEGTTISIESVEGKGFAPKFIDIKTDDILFVCAGAFSGIEKFFKENKNDIGLNTKKQTKKHEYNNKITNKELIEYGFIPEFIGRFGTITQTQPLNVDIMTSILRDKKNSILRQWEKTFNQFHIKVLYSNEFIMEVVEEALASKIGARGLNRIINSKLDHVLFDAYKLVNKTVVIGSNNKIKIK